MNFSNPVSLANEIYSLTQNHYSVLFVDFDGTLVSIQDNPNSVILCDKNKKLLLTAALLPNIEPVIVSGREMNFLKQVLQDIPISISAEHGAIFYNHQEVSGENIVFYENYSENLSDDIRNLENFFLALQEEYPGTFMETKKTSIAFHYRKIQDASKTDLLKDKLSRIIVNIGTRLIKGKEVFEFCFSDNTKGTFVSWWLKHNSRVKKIIPISIGDDLTDEFMFDVCNSTGGLSIKVGNGDTKASRKLKNTDDFTVFLEKYLSLFPPPSGLR
ncbi:MAG TPA: trehalose-phosphatase [Oligoflexia bacterium]|nr:trehalose-phosphatase [Oligoflexia bacterium]HMP47850.1 trehalose-phosphatase [Oligoflexia bacterium]